MTACQLFYISTNCLQSTHRWGYCMGCGGDVDEFGVGYTVGEQGGAVVGTGDGEEVQLLVIVVVMEHDDVAHSCPGVRGGDGSVLLATFFPFCSPLLSPLSPSPIRHRHASLLACESWLASVARARACGRPCGMACEQQVVGSCGGPLGPWMVEWNPIGVQVAWGVVSRRCGHDGVHVCIWVWCCGTREVGGRVQLGTTRGATATAVLCVVKLRWGAIHHAVTMYEPVVIYSVVSWSPGLYAGTLLVEFADVDAGVGKGVDVGEQQRGGGGGRWCSLFGGAGGGLLGAWHLDWGSSPECSEIALKWECRCLKRECGCACKGWWGTASTWVVNVMSVYQRDLE
ncbi:hypothetical protein K439DRAFT_1552535 [Ramaria rubella]|nr:hypothetical protein K439DRAFT_1552535 [Ramaria rubella]